MKRRCCDTLPLALRKSTDFLRHTVYMLRSHILKREKRAYGQRPQAFTRLFRAVLVFSFFASQSLAASYWLILEEKVAFENVQPQLPASLSVRYYSPALHVVSVNAIEKPLPAAIPGVRSVRPLGILSAPQPAYSQNRLDKSGSDLYGAMYNQLAMLKIPQVHGLGITGKNVRIGIVDTGFKKSLPAFQRILAEGRLIGERDFVFGDDDTDDDSSESSLAFATHGTGCWSQIGAYIEDEMIGAAYDAQFAIAKTEDIRSETRIEEDNFVAAVEWFDSLGVDVVSSSLAYLDFDGAENDYHFEDLDGNSTMVAQICNWADSRGMIIVTAIGNEGPGESSLWSPADAEGVISVGSVDSEMRVSYFSSRGPTADGRIKPDIVALGQSCALAALNGGLRYGTGTSFATPQIAGGIALLRSAFPAWRREDIMAAFQKHSQEKEKSNEIGWGVPDFYAIVHDYQSQAMRHIEIEAFPNPAHYSINLRWDNVKPGVSIKLYNLLGREIAAFHSQSYESKYIVNLPVYQLSAGIYFVKIENQSVRFVKL
jgi:serine protease AprX